MSRVRGVGSALDWVPAGPQGCFGAALPEGAAGCWCRVTARVPGAAVWWGKLEATDPARDQVVREAFLGPLARCGTRSTLLHLPALATGLTLRVFRAQACEDAAPTGGLRVLGRAGAACALLRAGWRLVPGALAGDPMGRLGRLRAVLGQAPARAGEAPGYDVWRGLYDGWGAAERSALAERAGMLPVVDVLVVGADEAGCAASLASLAEQWVPPARVGCVADVEGVNVRASSWTALVRAGDRLAPHALACLALRAARTPRAALIYADTDIAEPDGHTSPLFKPGADARLLRAGLLTRGACLVRGDVLLAGLAATDGWVSALAACSPEHVVRVPFVLTHLAHAEAVPAQVTAPVDAGRAWPFVSIVVPTSGRSRHLLRCLRRLLSTTDYPGGIEVLLAVSRVDPTCRVQTARLARAARLPSVRVLDLKRERFNYAEVNNLAVRKARGPLLVLLNDDVAPIGADWLARLVSHSGGAGAGRADIVGARLLYGNGRVQHGGVIMGLAHLCEHAFRLAREGDRGPHGLALLDREVSAVTGACLLTERSLYLSLGGMDKRFGIALNDVDFCLRARRAGARIVFAASVSLHHYEGLSLGRHYAGPRALLESQEVRRLADRWADVIANDPFYHPAASREPGREFQPGFPPKITALSWIFRYDQGWG